MWPVILRELRTGSRRWTAYWLRLLAAATVVIAIFFWFEGARLRFVQPGSELFAHIHRILLAAIWIVVPLMTCDCISSERREGTLGLLFLTDLRARDIICAKAFVHVVHALTLWAAVVPIIAVPLLLGGLGWREILFSIGWTLSSVCLASAAGIAASSVSLSRTRAAFSALLLSGGFFLLFAALGIVAIAFTVSRFIPAPAGYYSSVIGQWIAIGVSTLFSHDAWKELFNSTAFPPRAQNELVLGTFALAFISLLVLFGVIALAALQIRNNWQDKPKTARQTEMENFFYAPVFWTSLFRRWMRWSLERNPIGWLEKRSWTGRIAALIWLAVMVSFATTVASYAQTFRGDGMLLLNGLMFMLLASIAYVAAGSFRRERETGALELILVTPLKEREIIAGRLRGIWGQFLPAFLVWVAIVLYLYSWQQRWQPGMLIHFAIAYLAIPIVGLYFSLRTRIVLVAWGATLLAVFGLPRLFRPFIASGVALLFHPIDGNIWMKWVETAYTGVTFATHLLLAGVLLWRLHVNLARRSFSFR